MGLVLRSPSASLSGSLDMTELEKHPGAELVERTSEAGVFVHRLPWSATLGASWQIHPRLLVSADAAFWAATGPYAALQTEDMRESVDKKAVLNGAFGVELLPYGDVTLRAGVYTDRSSRRSAAVESLGDIAPDYWVYTGSLGYEAPRASIVFGMAWQTGSVDTAALSMRRDEIRWWVAGAYKL